ncbi:hypothetical protein GobsT_50320 [Gemmata obscuriglobus]|uniref:Uncharacterized protein n=1 Tax=Gemmata obscuriglobus TaxID=114 RepID=A0A2Z3GRR2_9BACT|nr:hypothetical protein [Gemmata obscuriglobus]AWM37059.1 hypothetical protein C1280_08510 [Gemmata obscuriglobus]QEG30229.1 hypothetical protein GobsT_50320 [Gemmata obscuriglobus]VTS09553.1 unnamed protein product [Gemmata obscuriglobus UQM 2246]
MHKAPSAHVAITRIYLILLVLPWGLFSGIPFLPGIGGVIAGCYLLEGELLKAAAWFFLPPVPMAWLIYRSEQKASTKPLKGISHD